MTQRFPAMKAGPIGIVFYALEGLF